MISAGQASGNKGHAKAGNRYGLNRPLLRHLVLTTQSARSDGPISHLSLENTLVVLAIHMAWDFETSSDPPNRPD